MSEFVPLLEAEIPRLRRYARALCWDPTRADDLLQTCLTRAVAKQHLWQPGTDLRAWLITMVHNQHVSDLRRLARVGNTISIDDTAPPRSVEPNVFAVLELRDLRAAIGKLSEEQRQAVLLVGLEEMPYEEAAAVLGIPTGTLRSRLSRARTELRRSMGMETTSRRPPFDRSVKQRRAA